MHRSRPWRMTEKKNHYVYLALGTNLGDRLANLKAAAQALASQGEILESSPIYETPPWGVVDQPAFLNQVLFMRTFLFPLQLLDFLKEQEKLLGREVSFRYGPRLIDMDILFYDELVLSLPELNIPHLQIPHRGFVLVPLADLSPDLVHPVSGLSVSQMLEQWMEYNNRSEIVTFSA